MILEYKPAFEIKCIQCGSTDVKIDSCVGFSSQSGGWGEVSLKCANPECKNEIDIWEPS